jgi:hypothetical protein
VSNVPFSGVSFSGIVSPGAVLLRAAVIRGALVRVVLTRVALISDGQNAASVVRINRGKDQCEEKRAGAERPANAETTPGARE